MIRFDLTAEEHGTLCEVLEGVISDLRFEVGDTDRRDFREELKRKEKLLKGMLVKAEAAGKVAETV
jgi:hypothetical protein